MHIRIEGCTSTAVGEVAAMAVAAVVMTAVGVLICSAVCIYI
jgi:hypothetical protein